MNKFTGIAIPAAIAGLLIASPQATAFENFAGNEQISFGARLNISSFDSDRFYIDADNIGYSIDDGFNSPQFGLEFSVPLTNRWAVRTYWDRVKTDVDNTGASATGHMFGTDALYYLNSNVYLGAGLNQTRVQRHRDMMFRATLGYRHALTDKLFLRAEVAPQFSSDYNDISFIVSANYAFGTSQPMLDSWGSRDTREVAQETPAPTDRQTDSDGDGVPDYRDDCANTPRNHVVDSRGCTVYTTEQVSENLRVGFEFDSARVTSDYNGDVRRLADFMKEHSDTEVVINGHTDLIGSAEYNRDLSDRRAKAVADILVNTHGISRSRITTVGHGMSRPVVNEISLSANERNRRTEAALSVEIRVPRTR